MSSRPQRNTIYDEVPAQCRSHFSVLPVFGWSRFSTGPCGSFTSEHSPDPELRTVFLCS